MTTITAANAPPPMELSPEQADVFRSYLDGKNVFMTGPGGSGKTALIRHIYHHASRELRNIAVCALTGCAALLLQCKARTLHSWAGIGLGNASVDEYVDKIIKNGFRKKMWRAAQILIVDEVSMLSVKLFDLVDAIARRVRRIYHLPFGGIQVIFSGDFYQLPPVGRPDDPTSQRFCFESAAWWQCFSNPRGCMIELRRIFRQTDDAYIAILNQIREGVITKKSVAVLNAQIGKTMAANSTDSCGNVLTIRPTELFPRRAQVDLLNTAEMARLIHEPEHVFRMQEVRTVKPNWQYTEADLDRAIAIVKESVMCAETLRLKRGAQVMCLINADFMCVAADDAATAAPNCAPIEMISLVNGSQGVITRFHEKDGYPIVRFYGHGDAEIAVPRHAWMSESIPAVGVEQIPLVLAWALTIHKSQGTTMDCAKMDIGPGIFEDGQTYVALSRVKSLEGLYLTSFDYKKIRINHDVQQFYEKMRVANAAVVVVADVASSTEKIITWP